MADLENIGGKTGHGNEDLPVENLEVSELEDGDLDDVSGGTYTGPTINECPITNYNC